MKFHYESEGRLAYCTSLPDKQTSGYLFLWGGIPPEVLMAFFWPTCKGLFIEVANRLPEFDATTLPMPRSCGTDRATSPIL